MNDTMYLIKLLPKVLVYFQQVRNGPVLFSVLLEQSKNRIMTNKVSTGETIRLSHVFRYSNMHLSLIVETANIQ